MDTAAVVKALRDQGVEEAYIAPLKNIYEGCTGMIFINKKSEKFSIRKEVRQGSTITPKFITACLEGLYRILDWQKSGTRVNKNI